MDRNSHQRFRDALGAVAAITACGMLLAGIVSIVSVAGLPERLTLVVLGVAFGTAHVITIELRDRI